MVLERTRKRVLKKWMTEWKRRRSFIYPSTCSVAIASWSIMSLLLPPLETHLLHGAQHFQLPDHPRVYHFCSLLSLLHLSHTVKSIWLFLSAQRKWEDGGGRKEGTGRDSKNGKLRALCLESQTPHGDYQLSRAQAVTGPGAVPCLKQLHKSISWYECGN